MLTVWFISSEVCHTVESTNLEHPNNPENMYDSLIQYINSQLTSKLTAEEIDVIKNTFVPKKIRKHQYLLQEGEVCKVAGFIVSGALKQYTIDDTGKENILGLYIENWWAGDRESFTNNTPSPYFIDAFEATEMLIVSKADVEEKLIHQRFMHDLLRVDRKSVV